MGPYSVQVLVDFSAEVAEAFKAKKIRGPIHLSGGNEEQLIEIFNHIKRDDWVLSTWRSHYHALLHGVPRSIVMRDILAGKSMFLHYPEYRFMTSSIVAGMCSIACGLAAGGKKVWCFVGDMAMTTGSFSDAQLYASCNNLPVTFVAENNGYSTNTPTIKGAWGPKDSSFENIKEYRYQRTQPHCGSGEYVQF